MHSVEIKYLVKTNSQSIQKADLRDAIDHEVGVVECARVTLRDTGTDSASSYPETAEVIYYPEHKRGACAWGGDAVWTDARSLEEVVERVLITGEVRA